jgi:hypothetical protein
VAVVTLAASDPVAIAWTLNGTGCDVAVTARRRDTEMHKK